MNKKELKKLIESSVRHALNESNERTTGLASSSTIEQEANDVMWADLETAILTFHKLCSKFKYVKYRLWQTDIDSVDSIEDFEGTEYDMPSLEWWTRQTNCTYIIEYDAELADELEELISEFMGCNPYETHKMCVFWRDDNFLDEDDLKEYYIKLSQLDKKIDRYLKTRNRKRNI